MIRPENVSVYEWGVANNDAPPLDAAMCKELYRRWWNDDKFNSRVTPVAFVAPTDEEVAIVNGPLLAEQDCRKLNEDHPIAHALGSFVTRFRAAVTHDIERNGLQGERLEHLEAGRYHRDLVPHVDDGKPAIKWMAAIGVGSTIGYNGSSRLSRTGGIVGLRTDVPCDGVTNLEKVQFPQGTVTRIPTFGTIHSWPEGEGARFYAQTTLYFKS